MIAKKEVSLILVAEGANKNKVGMTVRELIAGLLTLPPSQQVYVFNNDNCQLLRLDCLASVLNNPKKRAVIVPESPDIE